MFVEQNAFVALIFFVVILVSFAGSMLTLFSGFGLGTILVPVFGIFFPIEIAISLTAIVHFLNNLFKLTLFGKKADWNTVWKFGIPSIPAAFAGAYLLKLLDHLPVFFEYTISEKIIHVSYINFTIGFLILIFSLLELFPVKSNFRFNNNFLIGGLLSGFFGGLSGNQGALRSMFLIKANLPNEAYLATGIVIACMVDVARLPVYSKNFMPELKSEWLLVSCAVASAFLGVMIGTRLFKKITIAFLQKIVALCLFVFALLLMTGIV